MSDCLIRIRKVRVQSISISLLQIFQDESGISNQLGSIIDVGQFSLRCFEEQRSIDGFIRETDHTKVRLYFHAERTGIRQFPRWTKLVEFDHSCPVDAEDIEFHGPRRF